jgi:hypothetical protein
MFGKKTRITITRIWDGLNRLGTVVNEIRQDVRLLVDHVQKRAIDQKSADYQNKLAELNKSLTNATVPVIKPLSLVPKLNVDVSTQFRDALKANGMEQSFDNFAAITEAKAEQLKGKKPNAPEPVQLPSAVLGGLLPPGWDHRVYNEMTPEQRAKDIGEQWEKAKKFMQNPPETVAVAKPGVYTPTSNEKLDAIAEFLGLVFVTAPGETGRNGLPDLPPRVLALPAAVKKGDKVQ